MPYPGRSYRLLENLSFGYAPSADPKLSTTGRSTFTVKNEVPSIITVDVGQGSSMCSTRVDRTKYRRRAISGMGVAGLTLGDSVLCHADVVPCLDVRAQTTRTRRTSLGSHTITLLRMSGCYRIGRSRLFHQIMKVFGSDLEALFSCLLLSIDIKSLLSSSRLRVGTAQ